MLKMLFYSIYFQVTRDLEWSVMEPPPTSTSSPTFQDKYTKPKPTVKVTEAETEANANAYATEAVVGGKDRVGGERGAERGMVGGVGEGEGEQWLRSLCFCGYSALDPSAQW